MKGIEVPICRWGNGNGLRLAKSLLQKFGMSTGDMFVMDVEDERIILTPQKKTKKVTLQELFKDYHGPAREDLFGEEMAGWDEMKPVGTEEL